MRTLVLCAPLQNDIDLILWLIMILKGATEAMVPSYSETNDAKISVYSYRVQQITVTPPYDKPFVPQNRTSAYHFFGGPSILPVRAVQRSKNKACISSHRLLAQKGRGLKRMYLTNK